VYYVTSQNDIYDLEQVYITIHSSKSEQNTETREIRKLKKYDSKDKSLHNDLK